MSFIFVVLLLIIAPLAVSHFVKASFAAVLPSTLFGMALLLYAFGLADMLELGVVVTICLVGVLAAIALLRLRPQGWWPSLRASCTPAVTMFAAVLVSTFVLTRGMQLSQWDEFSEWGTVVKAAFFSGSLSPYTSIPLEFASYPPGLALFEYLVMKVGGSWHEANLFWAYQVLLGSLFIPFLEHLRWRQSARLLLILPIFGLGTIVFFNPFAGILVDPLLGLLFGYCLALVYVGNARSSILAVQLGLGAAMLAITKDSGTFFAAIAIALYLWKLLREYKPGRTRVAWLDIVTRWSIPVGAAAAASISWKSLLAAQKVPLAFSAPINIGELDGLTNGTGRPYWNPLLNAFGDAVVSTPLSHGLSGVPMSHLIWFGIALLAILALEFSRRQEDHERRNAAALVIILGGAVVYTVGLLVLYMFRFSPYEAVRLASFVRYLSTYWVAVIMLISLSVAARVVSARKLSFAPGKAVFGSATLGLSVGWLLALGVIAPASGFIAFVRQPVSAEMQARSNYEPVLEAATRAGVTADDRVWIISQHTSGYDYWVLRYDLMPSDVNVLFGSWSLGTPADADDIWTLSIPTNEWSSQLSTYDYVLIYKSSPSLVSEYSSLFANPSDIADGTIFKVVEDDDGVKLELQATAKKHG